MFVSSRLLKIANSRSLRPLSFVSTWQLRCMTSYSSDMITLNVCPLSAKTSLTNHNV